MHLDVARVLAEVDAQRLDHALLHVRRPWILEAANHIFAKDSFLVLVAESLLVRNEAHNTPLLDLVQRCQLQLVIVDGLHAFDDLMKRLPLVVFGLVLVAGSHELALSA